jgi:hypothetical protein
MTVTVALIAVVCASTLLAGGRPKTPKPEDVTLVGLVVDLQTYMTEKCANDDFAKCTRDNIRGGVPAALETEDGLIIVGMGDKGPARLLVPLAYQNAEVTGKLYDRDGFLYLDMSAAKVYKEESEEEPHGEEQPQPEGGTPPEP